MSRAGAWLCKGLTRGAAAAPSEQPNPDTKEEMIFKNRCSLSSVRAAPRLPPPPPAVTGVNWGNKRDLSSGIIMQNMEISLLRAFLLALL